MVDNDIVLSKASSVKKHIDRVQKKKAANFESFLKDPDCQDIILFNFQMAIQNCIDLAAHIISEEGFGVPGSNNEMLYLLEENKYISRDVTEKMVRAVGFRNRIVHEYGKIDLQQVYETANRDLKDIEEFLREIFLKLRL